MNEREIRQQMAEARKNSPAWKRELLRRTNAVAVQPGAIEYFRKHIRAVAKEWAEQYDGGKGSDPKEVFRAGPALTLPEKVFVLGAFHDAFCEAERMSAIMPEDWQGDVTRQVKHQGRQTEWFRTPDQRGLLHVSSLFRPMRRSTRQGTATGSASAVP